mgnify:CR=1 FL=1
MWTIILNRILLAVVTLFGVSGLVFGLVHIVPGDPVQIMLGSRASAEMVESIRSQLGLNDPLVQQYLRFAGGLLRGDLGTSISTGQPVVVRTLLMLLEEIGVAPRGGAPARLLAGDFDVDGALPLNTHGGLLAFGHSGVAGGLMHLAEATRQLAGRAGDRQIGPRRRALFHADGGVLSSHVSLVLEAL